VDVAADVVTLPPLAPLRRVLDALEAADIPAVVGGSAFLVALGILTEARDWDVVTDADPDLVAAALRAAGLPVEPSGPSERYPSELFSVDLDGAEIDVIVRFAVRADDGEVVHVPARAGTPWNGLPMARPDDWRAAYRAMGRPERAALLA
jgi:hypothetical protein